MFCLCPGRELILTGSVQVVTIFHKFKIAGNLFNSLDQNNEPDVKSDSSFLCPGRELNPHAI